MDKGLKKNHHITMILNNTHNFSKNYNDILNNKLTTTNQIKFKNNKNNNNQDFGFGNNYKNEIYLENQLNNINNNLEYNKIKINSRKRVSRRKETRFTDLLKEDKKNKLEQTITTKDTKVDYNQKSKNFLEEEEEEEEDIMIGNLDIKDKEINIKEKEKEIMDINNKWIVCKEGCGRKFLPKALEKHAKICKKLFSKKTIKAKINTNQVKKEKKITNNKKNWKKESENFRTILKQIKNKDIPLNADEFED